MRSFPVCTLLVAAACGDATADAISGPGSIVSPEGGSIDAGNPFCEGTGPLVQIPGLDTCTGDLGKKTFLFAVCSCTTWAASGALTTDSFSSLRPGIKGNGASVGVNDVLQTNTRLSIGGDVWSGGAATLKGNGSIARDVRAGATLTTDGTFTAGGDVYANGDVNVAAGSFTVGKRVHIPAGRTANGVNATGGVVNEPIAVQTPCACDRPIDIAGIVDSVTNQNDNRAAKLNPGQLAGVAGFDLSLPCGRYWFNRIAGSDLTLRVRGRTAVFVGGDLDMKGSFTIDVAEGSELDLFVKGDFKIGDKIQLGSPTSAAKIRIYVGGVQVTISGNVAIGANLYAPHAVVDVSSALEMSGAVLVKRLNLSGDFTVHYDEAVLDSPGCDQPNRGCTSCRDCAGAAPACKAGRCTACDVSADCCPPLVCQAGRCVPELR